MNRLIIPFQGYGEFRLYQNIEETKNILKNNKLKYSVEVWNNKECSNPIPWTIIRIGDSIHLFFANDKMFKIYLCSKCEGSLPNGITIGMDMNKACEIDPDLKYDDWEEDYQSSQGYWLEDDLGSGKVLSISIFIKEALNEEVFEEYKW